MDKSPSIGVSFALLVVCVLLYAVPDETVYRALVALGLDRDSPTTVRLGALYHIVAFIAALVFGRRVYQAWKHRPRG